MGNRYLLVLVLFSVGLGACQNGNRCVYDNAWVPGNWACRDMPAGMSAAEAMHSCEEVDLGIRAQPGTLESGPCAQRGVSYTGSCTYEDGSTDFFEYGNCSDETYYNKWHCEQEGGVFECMDCLPVEPSAECGEVTVDTCGTTELLECEDPGKVCLDGVCVCGPVTPSAACGEVVIDTCGNTEVLSCPGAGEVCLDGFCVCEPVAPNFECGEVVVDTCGNTAVRVCGDDSECVEGVCVPCEPVAPNAACGEVVIDTCGNTEVLECAPGDSCVAGVCVAGCDPVAPTAECGEVVIDTCGNTTVLECTVSGQVCQDGVCVCGPVAPGAECGEVVIDTCGNTTVLTCTAPEVCVNGSCQDPASDGARCLYDNAFASGNWSCRDMPPEMSEEEARQLCEVDSLGVQALPGTLEQGMCEDRDMDYTGKCVYVDGSTDWFEVGDCSDALFSNLWGCETGAGGTFTCLLP